jgi:hypothetical protein
LHRRCLDQISAASEPQGKQHAKSTSFAGVKFSNIRSADIRKLQLLQQIPGSDRVVSTAQIRTVPFSEAVTMYRLSKLKEPPNFGMPKAGAAGQAVDLTTRYIFLRNPLIARPRR